MTTAPPAIRCQGVSFGFGSEALFQNLTLDVPEGSFFAIVGRSGSGKTTFLRLVAGVLAPQTGVIQVCGQDPKEARSRKMISVCPQSPALLPWLTVRGNVESAFRMWGQPVDGAAVRWAIETVGLSNAAAKRPAELSGGMKARTALARAWVTPGARVLLMDESFSSVDEITRVELARVLTRLWQEQRKTVLFVTHVIAEAISLATHIWPLAEGERSGAVQPIVISDAHRRIQEARGRTVFHQAILSILGGGTLGEGIIDRELVQELRKSFSPAELGSVVALIRDDRFPRTLRLNLVQLLEPFENDGKIDGKIRDAMRAAIDTIWDSGTP
ncbi:MAG: ABC transporter ATP-binding protein, partial [bacterium]